MTSSPESVTLFRGFNFPLGGLEVLLEPESKKRFGPMLEYTKGFVDYDKMRTPKMLEIIKAEI